MLPTLSPLDSSTIKRIKSGEVFAYPTEGVWGIGCLANNQTAVERLRTLKARNNKGFILLTSNWGYITNYIENPTTSLENWKYHGQGFVTCIFSASKNCPKTLSPNDKSIAIRVTTHLVIKTLCEALDAPLVSTSANFAGEKPANSIDEIKSLFGNYLDFIVNGKLGDESKSSKLIDLRQNPPLTLRE